MAFAYETRVVGNRLATAGVLLVCLVDECIELVHVRQACLSLPASPVGEAVGWRATAVAVRQVVHAAARRRVRTVAFVPAPGQALPPPGAALDCPATLRARTVVSLKPPLVGVAWVYEADLTWRLDGRTLTVRARSRPSYLTCDSGPCPHLGEWEARIHARCLGCIARPTLTPVVRWDAGPGGVAG